MATNTDSIKKARAKYARDNVKTFNVKFYPSDTEAWEHLQKQHRKSNYVRALIEKDMDSKRYRSYTVHEYRAAAEMITKKFEARKLPYHVHIVEVEGEVTEFGIAKNESALDYIGINLFDGSDTDPIIELDRLAHGVAWANGVTW
jgi:hypothetical protein